MEQEKETNRFLSKLRIAIILYGIIIPAVFHINGGINMLFADFIGPFFVWTLYSFMPYLILFGLSFKINKNIIIFLPFLLMAIIEIFVNTQIILIDSKEKSQFILTFLPLYQLFITMPFSMLIGWIVHRIQFKKLPPIERKL